MTVIPELSIDSAQARGLRVLSLRNPGVTRRIGIVSRRSAPLSPLADQLRKLIVQQFTASPRSAEASSHS
jgi:DNA-binding transcriptional LysR family regulator